MHSFYSENGDLVTFNDIHELALFTSNDVVNNSITGYFVELSDGPTYKVSEEVYRVLSVL